MDIWNTAVPFFITENKMECYFGIPLDKKTGKYTMSITEYKRRKVKSSKNIEIFIKKGDFPVEYIKFSKEKKKKIGAPENKKEKKLIKKAFSACTKRKLFKDSFLVPVKGRISGVFGAMRRSGKETLWQHKGVDIANQVGTPVVSPAAGVVILVGEDFNLHGKTIVVDHGIGIVSLYIHLNDIVVKKGEKVERGGIIGHLGDTGLTTGPHLHWGMYVHSVPVNPFQWTEDK